ncbi:hypothetical protein Tco_0227790 [Tanacetum coccineum]
MELEPEIKVPGLECYRSLPEGVPFVNNVVIEEPEYGIFFTNVFGDQAFQRWNDIHKIGIDSLVSYLVMASMIKTPENARFSLKLKNYGVSALILSTLTKRSFSLITKHISEEDPILRFFDDHIVYKRNTFKETSIALQPRHFDFIVLIHVLSFFSLRIGMGLFRDRSQVFNDGVLFLFNDWTQFIQLSDPKVCKLEWVVNIEVPFVIVLVHSEYCRLRVGMDFNISDGL